MEKKRFQKDRLWSVLIKTLIIMKLSVFIICLSVFSVTATETFSQNAKISLSMRNVTIEDVMRSIEDKSEFRFFYAEKLAVENKVSIDCEKKEISEILDGIFKNTDISYRIVGRQIALFRNGEELPSFQSAQQKNISGKVVDSTGGSLPGVSVVVKGTTNGTITDVDGKYSLSNVPENSVLQFSFVGMKSQEVAVGNKTSINVILEEETIGIEEVVAIGYGTQKKSDLTGSVASVNSKDMEKANPTSFSQALQGRATGVMVSQSQGAPGSSGVIRIRGIGTVNNNEPLYVIDGMFAESMGDINPADIESMEVLKDASAQAIYGSRAANGVILISTKKGKDGKSEFNFNASYGISNPIKLTSVLGSEDYYKYSIAARTNGYLRSNPTVDPTTLDIFKVSSDARMVRSWYNLGYNTDWVNEVMHANAPEQKYDISYSGGTAKAKYSLSAGYLNQDGIISNSNYKRYTARVNSEFIPNKVITFGENIGMSYGKTDAVSSLTGSEVNGVMSQALIMSPLSPVYNIDANPYDVNYEYNKYAFDYVSGNQNGVALMNRADNVTKVYALTGNAYVQAKFFDGFTFKSSLGIDFNVNSNNIFIAKYYLSSQEHEDAGSIENINTTRSRWLWENTLSYNKTFGKHTINGVVGYTSEQRIFTNIDAKKTGVTSNDELFRVLSGVASASTVITATGSKNDQTMASALARINYVYGDRYLFTASVRNDGTSKFASGYKYGTFPSFSAGWRIINENFMKNLNIGVLSDAKFRAGWGTIGNQSILQDFGYLSLMTVADAYKYNFGKTPIVVSGSTLTSVGTSDIKWETTAQTNFGIDLGFFKNSLTINFDYYDKQTRDMLLVVTLPAYIGYTSNPVKNVGAVSNKGFEIVAGYKNKVGDFSYSVNANFSQFKNKVTDLQGGIITGSDIRGVAINRTQEGGPIGRFYGYKTNGIFQNAGEVTAYTNSKGSVIQPLAKSGDVKFKDLNDDGVINTSDMDFIGSPLPDFTYGCNIDLQYKNFSINTFFQGSYGNQIYDLTKAFGLGGSSNIPKYIFDGAWKGEGTSNSTPLFTNVDANGNFRVSDLMVQDASYLRLKNIQLGYDLPKSLCEKVSMKKLRVWLGGTNILTFTKYKGIDPEDGLTSGAPTAAGLVYTSYPKPQTFSLGVNATF